MKNERAEEALRESERLYRTLFDSISDSVLLINPDDFTITGANLAFLKQAKMVEGEVVGKKCYQVTHRRPSPCDICPMPMVVEKRRGITVEHIHYDRGGNPFYAEISVSPVDREGKITQVIHVIRDITERKRMEAEIKVLSESMSLRLLQKISQIENISKVKEKLRKVPDVSSGLDLILDTAIDDLNMDVGAVLIVDCEENALKVRGFKSRIEGMKVDESYPLHVGFAELEAVKQNKKMSRIVGQGEPSILATTSIHCAPIYLGKETYGILAIGSQKGLVLDSNDLAILGLYSELASTLFETQSLTITPMKEVSKVAKRRFELEFGHSYLVKNNVEKTFEVFVDQVLSGLEGLCITREFPPNVRRKYELERTPIVWLTEERAEKEITVNSLQELSILIQRFLENTKRSIVLLDGFEYLIINNGFERFIRFLQLSRSRFERSESILIAPMLEEALDLRDAKLLEREMRLLIVK